ncbi:hypothetical protein F7734_33415 [Scytonema sp. UIC 10036]|nr:hypothetical protein [Scytonema sp. UIC 10036]MUG96975.1 hypothetical protein [Scytonema sp. UIC 10036]
MNTEQVGKKFKELPLRRRMVLEKLVQDFAISGGASKIQWKQRKRYG